jgi:hypothetical protein
MIGRQPVSNQQRVAKRGESSCSSAAWQSLFNSPEPATLTRSEQAAVEAAVAE